MRNPLRVPQSIGESRTMDDPAEDDELVDDPHDETLVALNVHASFGLAAASCIASIIMIIAYYCQSSR